MDATLLILAWLAPLLTTTLAFGRTGRFVPVAAAVPGLVAALLVPAGTGLEISWLLLGVQLGLDESARVFLLFSSIVWLFAGLHAAQTMAGDAHAGRFRLFFLLAMAGNLLLLTAQDMASFYLGFAGMGLAAYGLIRHHPSQGARRAARVYLMWTLVGEVALFSGLVLLAGPAEGLGFADLRLAEPANAAMALILLGFGIKIALPGLHPWLPLAYTATPAAGAAVLSGPLITAGVLGLLRFLPFGQGELTGWGWFLAVWGLVGILLGGGVGLLQRDAKAVLAYSSIAKMGTLAAGLGAALAVPVAAPVLIAAVSLFTAHHLIVKSALFLGVNLYERSARRTWVAAGLVLLALALAGAPLSGIAAGKAALTDALPSGWGWLAAWLGLSSLAAVLLMGRMLYVLHRMPTGYAPQASAAFGGWALLAALALLLPLAADALPPLKGWPSLLSGTLIAAVIWYWRPRILATLVGRVPPGDILHLPGWMRRLLRRRRRGGSVELS